ncbi:MAG: hypothetical protein K2J15_05735 [Muribaculaceae bacterium]|nr:hypothetical protein [Muribaculaceae bacterium]
MDVLSYVKEKANLPSLMLGTGTVCAGTACAAMRGNLEWLAASLCLLFAIFTQVGTNLAYHYYRAYRNYDKVLHPRYERKEDVMNELHHRVLREGAFSCFIIAAMIGLIIMATSHNPIWVFVIGLVIAGLIYLMVAGKRPVFGTYRAMLFTWLLFGPVGVIGTGFVERQTANVQTWIFFDHAPALFLGPAMGFLACSVHLIFSYTIFRITPHAQGGIAYNLNPRGVQAMMFINGLLMLALVFIGVFAFNFLKPLFASVPAFMGFALNTFLVFRIRRAPIGELNYLNYLCKLNFMFTGLVFLIFWLYVGFPNESMVEFF